MSALSFHDVEEALRTVQSTLDGLTARGHDEAAFTLARAQYAASIRSSWPGNLSSLATALEKILTDTAISLTPDEQQHITRAVEIFRQVQHP